MVSNDVGALTPGQGCRAAFLDSTGHILADLCVLCLPDRLLVETDARCLDRLAQTLGQVSDHGEGAPPGRVGAVGRSDPAGRGRRPGPRRRTAVSVPRRRAAVPSADLWLPADAAPAVRESLIGRGAVAISEETAEALRVEAGLAAWGHELDETVLLPEAELDDAVSYTKGCYIGQEIVARIAARGHTNRTLRHILLAEDAAVPNPATPSMCRKTRRRRGGRSGASPAPSSRPSSGAARWRWPTSAGNTARRAPRSPCICASPAGRSSPFPARCGGELPGDNSLEARTSAARRGSLRDGRGRRHWLILSRRGR